MEEGQRVNGNPKRAGRVAPLFFAAVLVFAFGAGVWVGKPASERRNPAGAGTTKATADRKEDQALAACRQQIEIRSKAQAIASAARDRADELNRVAPEMAAQINALEGKLEDCQKRDIGVKADICGSADRYSIVMMALLYGAKSCVDTTGIGEFMVKNYDQCSEFDDISDDWDPGYLSKPERERVIELAYERRRFKKENWASLPKFVIRECVKKYGEPRE